MRWKLANWIPPSELPEYLAKWKHFQELPLRKLDDQAKKEYELVMKKDITYTIKKWGIDYSDLIPRHIAKYKVMPLNEKE
jgi:hypothetical protein